MGGNLRKYKKTPEYQQANHQMTVSEFKYIFFWEYFHRVLGRLSAWPSLSRCLFLAAQEAFPRTGAETARHLHARRAAGRDGLVHGQERAGRRPARQPVPADGPPLDRLPDLHLDVLGRARAGCRACPRDRRCCIAQGAAHRFLALPPGRLHGRHRRFVAGIRAGKATTPSADERASCRPRSS